MNLKFKLLALCVQIISLSSFAQQKGRFSIEANYGIQANFFVNTYNENTPFEASFLNKNVIGSIGGLGIKYHFNNKSALSLAYDRSANTREINYNEIVNGVEYFIDDFNIRHTNQFFQLGYEYTLDTKKTKWIFSGGLLYLLSNQQEINISGRPSGIYIRERNYKSYGLEEGGAFMGIQHAWSIDKHFDLGIRSKVFFLVSTGTFEAITLTPTLTYHFTGKQ